MPHISSSNPHCDLFIEDLYAFCTPLRDIRQNILNAPGI